MTHNDLFAVTRAPDPTGTRSDWHGPPQTPLLRVISHTTRELHIIALGLSGDSADIPFRCGCGSSPR
jgi:hypothetical protein